jgi:ppGpp synthetase/RelA/SpoT-type nucleotidyltranferase
VITPAEINSRYTLVKPYLDSLQQNVRETLSPYSEQNSFALIYRTKTLQSLSEKIESGRYASWGEIDDLVAFAIVIPTLAEEDSVVAFLQDKFRCVDLKRRGTTQKAPDVFRFDSTRFVGRLPTPPGATIERAIDRINFEVQVRSAFDHAWIVTTHALAYKSTVIDWRQQRLAAELKATAEKMDLLILAFQDASTQVRESPWPTIQAKKDISQFFTSTVDQERFPRELIPKDWSRFVDNVYDLGRRCGGRLSPEQIAMAIIDSVRTEFSVLGPERIPLSLSLWQITFASVFKSGILKPPFIKYWPLITPQLETLYPILKEIHPRFDFGAET